MKQITFNVTGMFCNNCTQIIEKALNKQEGVLKSKADYGTQQVMVQFDETLVSKEVLISVIAKAGYEVQSEEPLLKKDALIKWALLLLLFALIFIFKPLDVASMNVDLSRMSYGAIFLLGAAISVHCIGMCGGIQLSVTLQPSKKKVWFPSLQYNGGRVLGYTLVGGVLGLLGELVSFTPAFKIAISLLTGLLILFMGLHYLGLVRFSVANLLKPLGLGKRFPNLNNSQLPPLLVGFLNAFIPCGPLQVVQLYALSSGSALTGALSMLFFGLGTVPLMFGFGLMASFTGKASTKLFKQISGVLLIFIALTTMSRGLVLSGVNFNLMSLVPQSAQVNTTLLVATQKDGYQEVTFDLQPSNYADFQVKKGIPVKLTIKATEATLTGCNSTVVIRAYNIEKALVPGDNVIEFTPDKAGKIPYSCWMGMIQNEITVTE